MKFDRLPDGWSLVGSGFAPEGARLAWVTDEIQYGKRFPTGVDVYATLPRQWVDDAKVAGILADLVDSDVELVYRFLGEWNPAQGATDE